MTQSVVEKTSVPEKTWRRQTDSPIWWIAFSCGSVILHLLAFWLISLYKLCASQSGFASAVAIEFIEISPQKPSPPKSQPKPKPVLPKPVKAIVPQNSKPAVNQSAVEPPVSTNDQDAIAFDNQKIERQLAEQQLQQELLQQQQLAQQQRQLEAQQLQREAEQLRQRQAQQEKFEAQLRQREQEQQRKLEEKQQQLEAQQLEQESIQQKEAELQREREAQQEKFEAEQQRLREAQRRKEAENRLEAQPHKEAEQRELARQSQSEAEETRKLATQQQTQNPRDGEKITDEVVAIDEKTQERYVPKEASINNQQTPESPVKNNQDEEIPLDSTQTTQLNENGGILIANWDVVNSFKQRQDIPDDPPKLLTNIPKTFIIQASKGNSIKPVEFQVFLTIDREGKVEELSIDKNQVGKRWQQYQTYLEQNLKNKKLFAPATDIDKTTGELKPRASQSLIKIKIQQGS